MLAICIDSIGDTRQETRAIRVIHYPVGTHQKTRAIRVSHYLRAKTLLFAQFTAVSIAFRACGLLRQQVEPVISAPL